MAHIVLFHHVLGLTSGVQALARSLEARGHRVTTPDLFRGQTFPTLQAGLAHVADIGDEELLRRAELACAELVSDVVYAGLSLGAVPAQHLLATRPGARGGLLLHAFVDPTQLAGTWPEDCPVGVFAMEDDPFFAGDGDLDAARYWQRTHPNLSIRLYPGHGHLFTEPSLEDYDPRATETLVDDVACFLDRCDAP